ncbi:MAG: heavy-metal-associated domain-containing protein [Bacteroidetes bacterium]|nr:heavy-metal-associated domain-containing protein [Bacteroidota bacterium]
MSNTYTFSVPDMSCGHCKMHISNALSATTNVSSFEIDLNTKLVTVNTELEADAVVDVIDTAGYDAKLTE